MNAKGSWTREGVIAGIIGAAVVAIWFLIVDLVAGHPFYTPALLGNALFSFFGPTTGESTTLHVAGYTVFHVLAFMGIGFVASALINASRKAPAMLAGLLILFVAFQVIFYGVTEVLAMNALLGGLAWWSIGVANLLAAFSMGRYLYREHPELKVTLEHALAGAEA
ncbi:MAG: hypothetical protein HY275_02550 [Gemmatimonadetes bacterium]|nr:hypothetical protein [Gemmatimonadota bacterium]